MTLQTAADHDNGHQNQHEQQQERGDGGGNERLRRKASKRLGSNSRKEEARRAAELVAEMVWKSCRYTASAGNINGANFVPSHMNMHPPSDVRQQHQSADDMSLFDDTVADSASYQSGHSWERAIRRGLLRGARECNETNNGSINNPNSDVNSFVSGTSYGAMLRADDRSLVSTDLTTLPALDTHTNYADMTEFSSKRKQKEKQKRLKRQQQQQLRKNKKNKNTGTSHNENHNSGNNSDAEEMDENADAWMCGVCGKAFRDEEIATKHENDHIREVVAGLGLESEHNKFNETFLNKQTLVAQDAEKANAKKSLETPLVKGRSKGSKTEQHSDINTEKRISRDRSHSRRNKNNNRTQGSSPSRVACEKDAIPENEALDFLYPGDGDEKQEERSFDDYEDLFEGEDVVEPSTIEKQRQQDVETMASQRLSPPCTPRREQQQQGHQSTPISQITSPFGPDDRSAESPAANPLTVKNRPDVRFDPFQRIEEETVEKDIDDDCSDNDDCAQLAPAAMQDYVVLGDEALIDVCQRAKALILTDAELKAERELALLSKDKSYYDELAVRAARRNKNPSNRYRSEAENMLGMVQNKFVDAYQLMKEGDTGTRGTDEYHRKKKGDDDGTHVLSHTANTLYVNVMVRNSIQVVKGELARLARERWEGEETKNIRRFERFRVYAQSHIVKLAGLALASDFTPRRIAVQLSNDLYRLLTPRFKRRGVAIETEIDYRVGPYFVLVVNIRGINWKRLIESTAKNEAKRRAKWLEEQHDSARDEKEAEKKDLLKGLLRDSFQSVIRVFKLSVDDVLSQVLAWFYYVHWIIYLPICYIAYSCGLGKVIRHFIVTGVTDEIFYYVGQKGMEMEIKIENAGNQAGFMLSALREIRADGRELKKKQQETESQDTDVFLGPLLGPSIKEDKGPAVEIPGFKLPENLEFVSLELEVPCGFQRLRWALCHKDSKFILDAILKASKCENITCGQWSKFDEHIGIPSSNLPDSENPGDFLLSERESSYLMPKSAFVNAAMAYETCYLIAYNDYCLCLKYKTLTPDVPFGGSFVAWTQTLIVNTGDNSSKVTFSVEPEFPNGPPMVARQIVSGMKAGTLEKFVQMGETITKYAEKYP